MAYPVEDKDFEKKVVQKDFEKKVVWRGDK